MQLFISDKHCEEIIKIYQEVKSFSINKSLNENTILIDAKENIKTLESILKNVMPKIPNGDFINSSNRIVTLKEHFKCIVEGILPIYHKDINFSQSEITEIINMAIIDFLLIWIENAENTKQNTYSFAKQKYALSSEQKRHKRGEDILDVDEKYRAKLNRIIEKLNNNYLLNEINSKRNGVKIKQPSHIENKEFNFIDLCFVETYAKGELSLYKLLYINKEPFVRRHNETIKKDINKGYKDYVRFLNGISKEDSDRLYVIKSLLFFKLESTYRWTFGAKLGQYMYDNKIDITVKIPNELDSFYNRQKNWGFINGIDISPFIKNYDSIITSAYKEKLDENAMSKILLTRFIVEEITAIYCHLFHNYIKINWTKKDFSNAAIFLKEDYNISEVLAQLSLKNYTCYETPSVFDYIKTVFLNLGLYDTNELSWARDNIKNSNIIDNND